MVVAEVIARGIVSLLPPIPTPAGESSVVVAAGLPWPEFMFLGPVVVSQIMAIVLSWSTVPSRFFFMLLMAVVVVLSNAAWDE